MLFRVIQELVNNIIKHAKAQNAEIIFSRHPNSDDGIGYEDANNTGNQGLYSITQRLKLICQNLGIILKPISQITPYEKFLFIQMGSIKIRRNETDMIEIIINHTGE